MNRSRLLLVKHHLAKCYALQCEPNLAFVLHHFVLLDGEPAFVDFLRERLLVGGGEATFFTSFTLSVLKGARPLSFDSLVDLKITVKQVACPGQDALLRAIEQALALKSPVLSRWHAEPEEDVHFWTQWKDETICASLTSLCEPFYHIRASSFAEPMHKHLEHLLDVGNSLSAFVMGSTLCAAAETVKRGVAMATRWISIAEMLVREGNFHMAHAVCSGLNRHQVDRLQVLWSKLPRKVANAKRAVDELFEPLSRCKKYHEALMERLEQRRGMTIPSLFLLHEKSLQLEEVPLLKDRKTLNDGALQAARNVFTPLLLAQEIPYTKPSTPVADTVTWYFMQLHRVVAKMDSLPEDVLYHLSDQAKSARLGVRPTFSRSRSKLKNTKISLDDFMSTSEDVSPRADTTSKRRLSDSASRSRQSAGCPDEINL